MFLKGIAAGEVMSSISLKYFGCPYVCSVVINDVEVFENVEIKYFTAYVAREVFVWGGGGGQSHTMVYQTCPLLRYTGITSLLVGSYY